MALKRGLRFVGVPGGKSDGRKARMLCMDVSQREGPPRHARDGNGLPVGSNAGRRAPGGGKGVLLMETVLCADRPVGLTLFQTTAAQAKFHTQVIHALRRCAAT